MYQLIRSSDGRISIRRVADGALIPRDPLNIDYQAFQVWLDAGNQPERIDTPPMVVLPDPNSVEERLRVLEQHVAELERGTRHG
jgi:hypothetical protein